MTNPIVLRILACCVFASFGCGRAPPSSDPLRGGEDGGAPSLDAGTSSGATGVPKVPPTPSNCPTIATGTVTVLGQQVRLWVGALQSGKRGPVMFYWHGTGSSAAEAELGLGPIIREIEAEGGVVASFSTTTGSGQNTGNGVWFTGDFGMADIIFACAVEQRNVDPRRVYAGGCSAGGLQASAMSYERSGYVAGAMPNSGGTFRQYALQDPAHVPAVIAAHGAPGRDVVQVDFSITSTNFVNDIAAKGGFAVRCNHGGGHCATPLALRDAQWELLKVHPFGVTPSPYAAGLPAGFPDYCEIAR